MKLGCYATIAVVGARESAVVGSKVYVWPESPPHAFEPVVLRTTRLGSDQS
jgi:hypothetical protein